MGLLPKIVVIVGPTASGKSDLAVLLAKKWRGEVISADSRQVYRGMNIGTGKITRPQMRGIPHHLLDVASPKRRYSVADYKRDAERALRGILERGKLPIICGGTGFYISALVDNLLLPDVKPNLQLRKHLEKKSPQALLVVLKKLDPKRAKTIDAKNPRRLIRAIEIAQALGKVPPLVRETPYDALFLGLHVKKEELNKRIHQRLIARLNKGMVAEVRKLHKNGVSEKRMEDLGLEYRFCFRYLNGAITKEILVQQLERAIRQYATRQMTWFKKDERIHWIALGDKRGAEKFVSGFLGKPASARRKLRW